MATLVRSAAGAAAEGVAADIHAAGHDSSARAWADGFGGRLKWTEPKAGAIGLMKYGTDTLSRAVADRIRLNQSTLIVPGSHVGLEGHLRIWLGGKEEFLREGLRRIGTELKALFD